MFGLPPPDTFDHSSQYYAISRRYCAILRRYYADITPYYAYRGPQTPTGDPTENRKTILRELRELRGLRLQGTPTAYRDFADHDGRTRAFHTVF
jgi:hypothetical protein